MFSKFNRHLEPQHRTRPGVEPVCDGVKLFLTGTDRFVPLGKYSRIEAIGVFIAAALPSGCVGQQSTPERPCARSALCAGFISALIIRQGLRNDGSGMRLSMAVSASSAEAALASGILANITSRLVRLDQRGNGRKRLPPL